MSYHAYPPGAVPSAQPATQAPSQAQASQAQAQGAQAMHYGYAPYQPGMMPASGYGAGYHSGYQQMPMAPMGMQPGFAAMPGSGYSPAATSSFLNLGSDRFLKGLLIGAAAAYLLTNESVQRTAIKGVVKLWGGLQGGVEEIKERFQDAEAEIQASEANKDA